MTHDLPTILLSYGIKLKKTGNQYIANCIAHEDHNPSMSVYVNGTGKYTTHCHACGFHEDAIGVVAHLENISFKEAAEKLDDPHFNGKGKWATIDVAAEKIKKQDRITIAPPPDMLAPKMDWLTNRDGVSFGAPVEVFVYRTSEGDPWFYEARFMVDGKKEPRCFTYGYRGIQPRKWECGFYNRPRPIYGLDQLSLKPKAQVVVCEGPRKADAAQKLLPMPCVGWAGGAEGWQYSDWTPLQGKKVILWPDADEPGRKAMKALAQHLLTLNCQCWVLETAGIAEGWDAADALIEGYTPETMFSWCKSRKGEEVKKTEDKPILEHPADVYVKSKAPEFGEPFNVFTEIAAPRIQAHQVPKVIADWMYHLDGIVGTDRSILGISALVICAGAIHDAIKIQPEIYNKGWSESARLWAAIVGDASIKKSPALDRSKGELEAIEKEIVIENRRLEAEYKTALKIYDKMEKDYVDKVAKGDKSAVPPTPPEQPELQRLFLNVATVEKIEQILRNSSRGLISHRDELVEFFGSLDAYKSKGGSDRGAWLSLYNGGGRHIDKVGAGSYHIKNWSSSLIGGIQPDPMRKICANMDENGLLQRFMVVTGKPGKEGNQQHEDQSILNAYNNVIRQLYSIQPSDERVTLTEDANNVRREITGKAFELIGLKYVSSALCSHLGKWEGLSARLLLTFHCIICAQNKIHPQSTPVSVETALMVKAFMLEFLLPHATAFYIDIVGNSQYGQHINTIANYLLVHKGLSVTNSNIRESCSPLRPVPEHQYQTIMRRMVDYGWILPDMTRRVFKDFPSTWHINPKLRDLHQLQRENEVRRRAYEAENARDKRSQGHSDD